MIDIYKSKFKKELAKNINNVANDLLSKDKNLQSFIEEARSSKEKNTYFIAIADGDYYATPNGTSGNSKMCTLRSNCTPIVKACSVYDLEKTLESLE